MSCTIFHYRVYIEDIDLNVRKLYITRIEEGDAGIYGCKAVINNEDRWKNLTLALFSKYFTVAKLGQSALAAIKTNVNKCIPESDNDSSSKVRP